MHCKNALHEVQCTAPGRFNNWSEFYNGKMRCLRCFWFWLPCRAFLYWSNPFQDLYKFKFWYFDSFTSGFTVTPPPPWGGQKTKHQNFQGLKGEPEIVGLVLALKSPRTSPANFWVRAQTTQNAPKKQFVKISLLLIPLPLLPNAKTKQSSKLHSHSTHGK